MIWSLFSRLRPKEKGMKAELISYFGRQAVNLENDSIRTVIDSLGGMMPEFSLKRGRGGVNAHWIPDFRGNSGEAFDPARHGGYWKSKLLYQIAGDFPCSPNFGGDCVVDGVALPAHGWTANEAWTVDACGLSPDGSTAYARHSLRSPDAGMPLSWTKCDMVLAGQPAYYSVMRVRNTGDVPVAINLTRHNTVGAPFLQAGCKISLCADRFKVAPEGTEFERTGRLWPGAEFADLRQAPLWEDSGATADLTTVPGMIGATDFVTGAIPLNLSTGWSCVVNPVLGLAYVCFFPGPAALPDGEVALSFNDLWMQYGGRKYTPWSLNDGGSDRTFCLGTENGVGAFASGLAYARENPQVLGRPTMVTIPAGGERKLCYGTAIIELTRDSLLERVTSVKADEGCLVIGSTRIAQYVKMDAHFERVRKFESEFR